MTLNERLDKLIYDLENDEEFVKKFTKDMENFIMKRKIKNYRGKVLIKMIRFKSFYASVKQEWNEVSGLWEPVNPSVDVQMNKFMDEHPDIEILDIKRNFEEHSNYYVDGVLLCYKEK